MKFTHFCLFAGMGGASIGLNRGHARVGSVRAELQCVGGVDVMPAAVKDFTRLTGTQGTLLDLFDREDYEDFHGKPPPIGWSPATADDIRKAAHGHFPDIVFTSPPCKGFSGLLNNASANSKKYAALNNLTIRGFMLILEAFKDNPPSLILMENVPRIAKRGRPLLQVIHALLNNAGYATSETVHNCGNLGGLAQSRKRFLLVARHKKKIKPFLYEPPQRRLRSVGEVITKLPMPQAEGMHSLPNLQWKTWVRLALIEAGKDWKSLNSLRVRDGYLTDLRIEKSTIDDPRAPRELGSYQPYGVIRMNDHSHTVTAKAAPGSGAYSIADPRLGGVRHNNVYRIVRWSDTSNAVTTGTGPSSGGLNIADPRSTGPRKGESKHRVTRWGEHSGTVVAASGAHQGATAIADPRRKSHSGQYENSGLYGVTRWDSPAHTITAGAKHDTGRFSVADPRAPRIISLDNTWHRPFTTFELAALQGFPVLAEDWDMDGSSHTAWRQRIGNAIPPPAAQAIGNAMAETLLLNQLGESFRLSPDAIWVKIALSMEQASV